jgi:type I restriction enzyme, R subunit
LVEGDASTYERHRQRVVEIAMLLEAKGGSIPAIAAQLAYLSAMQETIFWEGMTPAELESLRRRLRDLVPLLDKKKRNIVYTDFKDEVLAVRDEQAIYIPRMTGVQYAKKVKDFLRNHLDHMVIHRLRMNQPLTALDLKGLEQTLVEIGEEDGESLLSGLVAHSGAPSLAHFVRSLVGMDRAAAQAAFSQFLNDRSLTAAQIRFIEMVIDQLTVRGMMTASALYEPPFSNLHAGGPDALFAGKEKVIDGVFQTLASMMPKVA